MCYDKLGNLLNKTEKYDPITPKLAKAIMKNDSATVESIAKKWNWNLTEEEAKRNQEKPEEGIARAGVATGLGFLTAGMGNAAQAGAQGANAGTQVAGQVAVTAAEKAAEQAAIQAAQEIALQEMLQSAQFAGQQGLLQGAEQGLLGAAEAVPQGFANTMEAGLLDTGYTPSSLWNAAKYGPESGQSMGQTMGNYAQGKVDYATSPGVKQEARTNYLRRQGTNMMKQDEPQQAPPPRPYQQQEEQPIQSIYGDGLMGEDMAGLMYGLTEEEKRRLRQQGLLI
jgi:hypothetical protein